MSTPSKINAQLWPVAGGRLRGSHGRGGESLKAAAAQKPASREAGFAMPAEVFGQLEKLSDSYYTVTQID